MENEIIFSRGRVFELLPETYWHLAHHIAGFLLHNVTLNEGICWSISEVRRMPNLENALSPYSLKIMDDRKEKLWEKARIEVDQKIPSRNGVFFVFESDELALRVMETWFPKEEKHLLRVRILKGSNFFKADAKWLDCIEDKWEENAKNYWTGKQTSNPLPEILVDGGLYFPDWKRPPFGIGTGIPK